MASTLLDEDDEILDFAVVLARLQAHLAANKPKRPNGFVDSWVR
jgi:hypothetical protein